MWHSGDPGPGPEHGGECGAHAPDGGIGGHHVVQDVVGPGHRIGERVQQFARGQVLVEVGENGDGHRAGDLARGVAAHAVSDRQQAWASVCRVLVPLTEEADI